VLVVSSLAADPVPKWPRQFYFQFNETYVSQPGVLLPGFMALDLDYQGGSESMYRSDGFYDHICSGVQPNYHGPCQQIYTGGYRYIIVPDNNFCCRCCNSASGCGALYENWIANAVWAGNASVSGVNCNHWTITGNEVNNLWETTSDSSVICLLDNSGSDIFTVLPQTYKLGPPDASVFTIPNGCTNPCPAGISPCSSSPTSDVKERSHEQGEQFPEIRRRSMGLPLTQ